MPTVFPTATLGSRDSGQVFSYMLVHCKYTHFLPHRPCQFDSNWLFVEHAHFCSCQMSCPSWFSGTSGPCCHMFFFFFSLSSMVDERQEQCGVCASGFVWVAGAFFCKSCGRPLYAAAFAPSSIPGSLALGCECSLVIWEF